MDDNDVFGRTRRYAVRLRLPERGIDSFTVIGPDRRPVELIDEYLAWLSDCERSPNTVEAYAHDLRAFWTFLAERGLRWDRVDVRCGSRACPASCPSTQRRGSGGSRSTGRSRAARKACSAPRPAAPRRTSYKTQALHLKR